LQNNFHLFRLLTPILENRLRDAVVSECFTQDKDELIIRFESHDGPFFVRATLSPVFACISFPENFHRARKNSTDLFSQLLGERVKGVYQYSFERSFAILLSTGFSLLFKMHGNRANVLVVRENVVEDIFKKNLVADLQLIPTTLERAVDWTFENFLQHKENIKKLFFTFGKIVWEYLDDLGFFRESGEIQWKLLQDLQRYLDRPTYFITAIENKLHFSLVRYGRIINAHNEPVVALNDFYQQYVQNEVFDRERSTLLSAVNKDVLSLQSSIDKAQQRLNDVSNQNNYKIWADLIMANMHRIAPGQDRVTLADFYHENNEIEIKLRKELTPQKNAAVYYTKSKKQQIEIAKLVEMAAEKQTQIVKARALLTSIEQATELKTLRVIASGMKPDRTDATLETVPYHEFDHLGYRILVGKNALANDTLLKRFSHKDDLWLHAKDVAGSHVLIKYQAGKNFPKDVIVRAAQLAGYNSKRKTESLCAIMVTPRKYVRKRKGDPAGAVVVEREEVILVEPRA
jgi:predicted ribosome quality control (RQC) complex YloA/Tae2 family protein